VTSLTAQLVVMGTACTTQKAANVGLPAAATETKAKGGQQLLQKRVSKRVSKLKGKIHACTRYHRLPRQVTDDYILEDKGLGKGMSGTVMQATSKYRDGLKYAVKSFRTLGITSQQKADVVNELSIYLCLDHPFICRLCDLYETDEEVTMVMECAEGGNLLQKVKKNDDLNEASASKMLWQMLIAVKYLHDRNIVHRDLKLENFVISSVKGKGSSLKLIDFGLSKVCPHGQKLTRAAGTLPYAAPEVLKGSYDTKADLWSLGVMVYILLTGTMPFFGKDDKALAHAILGGKYSTSKLAKLNVSLNAQDFLKKLLVVDPNQRLTAAEALQHPWLQEHDFGSWTCTDGYCFPTGAVWNHSEETSEDVMQKDISSLMPTNQFRSASFGSGDTSTTAASSSGGSKQAKPANKSALDFSFSTDSSSGESSQAKPANKSALYLSLATASSSGKSQQAKPAKKSALDISFANALIQYSKQPCFRRLIMYKVAWCLRMDERCRNAEAFWELDMAYREGEIRLSAVEQALQDLNVSGENVMQVMTALEELDMNHDGRLGYSEFISTIMLARIDPDEETIRAAFRYIDHNGSGYMQEECLKSILDPSEANETLQQVDFDGDGKISLADFVAYWNAGKDSMLSLDELKSVSF